jgi:hypothetical protein
MYMFNNGDGGYTYQEPTILIVHSMNEKRCCPSIIDSSASSAFAVAVEIENQASLPLAFRQILASPQDIYRSNSNRSSNGRAQRKNRYSARHWRTI